MSYQIQSIELLRHEGLDVDGAGAFQRHRVDLVVLQHDVVVLAARIALDLVLLVDGLAGDGIDIAALHPVAGLAVEGVEAQLFGLRGGRRHRHGAGHQR